MYWDKDNMGYTDVMTPFTDSALELSFDKILSKDLVEFLLLNLVLNFLILKQWAKCWMKTSFCTKKII